MNPLTRLLAGLAAVLAMVGALFFGLFVLVFVVGLGLLAWLVMAARLWWLRRGTGKQSPIHGSRAERRGQESVRGSPRNGTRPGDRRSGEVIDADFEVVSKRRDP